MEEHFGSKLRAKQEILARYCSMTDMGNGQHDFANGVEYDFGR